MDTQKRYHYFYKITNNVNGKFYYGIHSTSDLEDGYMGSGTRLFRAIAKYGIESFTKEILQFFDSREEASLHESKIVNVDMINDPMCYNLRTGGDVARLPGGRISRESIEKRQRTIKERQKDPEYVRRVFENRSKACSKPKPAGFGEKVSKRQKGKKRPQFWGVPKSEEHRRKISESLRGRHLSEEHKSKLRKPKPGAQGKPKSKEHIQKILETKRKNGTLRKTEEVRKKISEQRKGRIWLSKLKPDGKYTHKIVFPGQEQEWLDRGYIVGRFGWKDVSPDQETDR